MDGNSIARPGFGICANRTALAVGWLLLALFGIGQAEPLPLEHHEQGLVVDGETVIVRIARGLELELLTNRLREPRLMTFGARDELLIGSKSGLIYRLTPPYTEPQALAHVGGYPHSAAVRDAELFVARTNGVFAIGYDPTTGALADKTRPVAELPGATAAVASPWVPMAGCM